MEGKYIYCITKGLGRTNFGSVGMNNGEVVFLPYRDIAAVVSNTPIINFDRLNKEKLTKYVAIHQKVNEAIIKQTDAVPLSFGVIAPSVSEVMRILAKAYLQFKQELKKVEGKVEFVVHVRWDKEGLVSERNTYIKNIQDELGNITYDFTLNKLIDEEMLVNFSFLIERTQEPELDAKMQDLGRKYEGKLRFKYIGPMPPYSFSNINLSLGNFELVDSARKVLGLAEEATWDEIRKEYHHLAHKFHPDKYEGATQVHGCQQTRDEQMNKIIQAHGVLTSYCHACDELLPARNASHSEAGEPDNRTGWGQVQQRYSFREEDVKNSAKSASTVPIKNMEEIIALFATTYIKIIVVLILVDVVLGIIGALVRRNFVFRKLGNFMKTPILGYVLGFVVVELVGQAVPALAFIVPVALVLAGISLLASIIRNLGIIGLPLPGILKK